jgi:glutamate-ammonia-ligase adenylyltransferase
MHRLRLRMQHELAQEGDGRFDLKVGRGGLLDVEFACQWLQMRHGADSSVRTTDSVEALAALHEAGHLDEDTFRELSEGYKFLRQLEQRMRVLHGTGTTVIDTRQAGLPQLARRMGLHQSGDIGAVELLIARYQAVTASVREAYLRVLGLQPAAGPED